ncbi:MAG: hypothetical protein EXR01_02375 [Acetobacteraceae bacterium]|nr:hypothetical protein [Acetobacteraceae bacterium]
MEAFCTQCLGEGQTGDDIDITREDRSLGVERAGGAADDQDLPTGLLAVACDRRVREYQGNAPL